MAPADPVPVIAIDGPSASGKGTVASLVARALDFHYLDSGALYRAVGYAARNAGLDLEDELGICNIILNLNINFLWGEVKIDGCAVTDALREESVGNAASKVAALPGVRQALLGRQRAFRQPPGLVADGRDMGSVVFPDARVKIFLTAAPEERAERRYKQLIDKGLGASMNALLQDIRERDARDSARAAAPLQKCGDAIEIDTTGVMVGDVVVQVLAYYRQVSRVP